MLTVSDQFYMDGRPFQIISGSFHYFRTVPQYWPDRLEKLVNMGCNTVETYIPWNFHEPEQGKFRFDGMADICHFLDLATQLGLYIILRPSPYICSEWEFGGLPAWLLKDPSMRLRCSYGPYLEAVRRYYSVLLPKLVPYQQDRGGRLILLQLENEYGYYGDDTAYLEFLRDTVRQLGITVPLVTSDGPWSEPVFRSGCVEGALPTGNFGSNAQWQFAQMRKYMGDGKPLMCMEFWNGWFDAWGEPHHTTPAETAARELDAVLKEGSVNFYMFQGGTNFGFMSGRNAGSTHADVTSYDYDAPLTEDGQLTQKYHACREVIEKYRAFFTPVPLTTRIRRAAYGTLECNAKTDLFSTLNRLGDPIESPFPVNMEQLDQNYGYILYRTHLRWDETPRELLLEDAADRIQGYINGTHRFTAFADTLTAQHDITTPTTGGQIDLLCENIGRENFGTNLENQRKGIRGGVKINGHRHFGYSIYPLPLDSKQLERVDFSAGWEPGRPAFYRFAFPVDTPADTFLDTQGFGKGCAFLNGFNLGRFWEIGPQKRLYIPAPLLRRGENTLILFETEGTSAPLLP